MISTNNHDIALTIASDEDDDEESMNIYEIIIICRVDNGDSNLGSNLNFYYFIYMFMYTFILIEI